MSAEEAGKAFVRCDKCGRERLYLYLPQFDPPKIQLMPCVCVQEANRVQFERIRMQTKRERLDRLFNDSNLGDELRPAAFASVDREPGVEEALAWCRAYAEGFSMAETRSALLFGLPGVSKSWLAAATGKEIIERKGIGFAFANVPELLRRVRGTYGGRKSESESELVMELIHAPLVVLDDIGAQYNGAKKEDGEVSWAEDLIYGIVDGRFRHSRPVLFTANVDTRPGAKGLPGLERAVGARTYDRMVKHCTFLKVSREESFRRKIARERLEGKT